MNKQQIILVAVAVIAMIGLYSLPRVVVENETETEVEAHDFSISDSDSDAIASLRASLNEEKSGKNLIFADSLARLYLKYGFADSAYSVVKAQMLGDSSLRTLEYAAPLLYTLYERAMTPEQAVARASEARFALEQLLEANPDNPSFKTKLAMTMVTTDRPMVGIQMLREVLDEYPENREAIINLGLLSIRSGQFGRGVERFKDALRIDSTDHEAMLFLGVCYQELEQADSAKYWFEKITVAEDADPAIQAAAVEYLEEN